MSTPNQDTTRYSLTFTVPHSSLSACKDAIFAVGAGTYGPEKKYTRVCFLTPGLMEFTPGKGAEPKIGKIGREERVEEMRVQVMCEGRAIAIKAVEALKRPLEPLLSVTYEAIEIDFEPMSFGRVHPYEEVAYEVLRMEDI